MIRADSSLKCCLVADGSADLCLRVGPTCEWDTGASQCIVEEAGGRLTDCSDQALRYNAKEVADQPVVRRPHAGLAGLATLHERPVAPAVCRTRAGVARAPVRSNT